MKLLPSLAFAPVLLAALPVQAQPGAFNPPLLDCGSDGEVELICGTRAPEDFEVTPDGRQLIIANFGRGDDFPLEVYDFALRRFSDIPLGAAKLEGWGDPACTESIGAQVSPHGLSLTQRGSGEWQFYVVNHNVRESPVLRSYCCCIDSCCWTWTCCPFGGYLSSRQSNMAGIFKCQRVR